jgi:hypothetical protein
MGIVRTRTMGHGDSFLYFLNIDISLLGIYFWNDMSSCVYKVNTSNRIIIHSVLHVSALRGRRTKLHFNICQCRASDHM